MTKKTPQSFLCGVYCLAIGERGGVIPSEDVSFFHASKGIASLGLALTSARFFSTNVDHLLLVVNQSMKEEVRKINCLSKTFVTRNIKLKYKSLTP